ncbi:MAG: hypothetical protein C4325_06760 [Blastocatellia bacterium]
MTTAKGKIIDCSVFEDALSDYLERILDTPTQSAMAAHSLECPLCHSLLNDVKSTLRICREMNQAPVYLSGLEAKILSRTSPATTIQCAQFEEHLTDYLDGFLPAPVFHRWERHAALCDECSDLPGLVVRSLAALVNYKTEELPVPDGLHSRILASTIGTLDAAEIRPAFAARLAAWIRRLRFPLAVPQLAPVALMTIIAFLVFSQAVSADGSLMEIYTRSFRLAEESYRQGAEVFGEATGRSNTKSPTVPEDKQ